MKGNIKDCLCASGALGLVYFFLAAIGSIPLLGSLFSVPILYLVKAIVSIPGDITLPFQQWICHSLFLDKYEFFEISVDLFRVATVLTIITLIVFIVIAIFSSKKESSVK